ncbi:host attachment family protein, partial [Sphingomonas sp.]|uniref:host attachment family protein n=1 Tax=Sphingomonas sp. TaxID=28214 RepID=UPI002CD5DC26
MKVPHDAVVLVADGRKALMLRNEGDAAAVSLQVEHHEERANPADRDQASDLAGRSASVRTAGANWAAGGNVENTDFHQQGEDRFAAETAAMLNERALRQDFESLIIIAAPRTLGELRKHYHSEVS